MTWRRTVLLTRGKKSIIYSHEFISNDSAADGIEIGEMYSAQNDYFKVFRFKREIIHTIDVNHSPTSDEFGFSNIVGRPRTISIVVARSRTNATGGFYYRTRGTHCALLFIYCDARDRLKKWDVAIIKVITTTTTELNERRVARFVEKIV